MFLIRTCCMQEFNWTLTCNACPYSYRSPRQSLTLSSGNILTSNSRCCLRQTFCRGITTFRSPKWWSIRKITRSLCKKTWIYHNMLRMLKLLFPLLANRFCRSFPQPPLTHMNCLFRNKIAINFRIFLNRFYRPQKWNIWLILTLYWKSTFRITK